MRLLTRWAWIGAVVFGLILVGGGLYMLREGRTAQFASGARHGTEKLLQSIFVEGVTTLRTLSLPRMTIRAVR